MSKIVLVTGSSSGFGRLTAEALARAGHTVYASMRDIAGRNAENAAELTGLSARESIDLRPVELDVQSEPACLSQLAYSGLRRASREPPGRSSPIPGRGALRLSTNSLNS
jgi:NAD(P)-dependent dehydrogenase (short-subunit alcohol dehydrogenase family)